MSVVIKDDELELFNQNGVTQDQIANTVNTYRNQGLSDEDIRSKVDIKLNEYRSSMQQPSQPEQNITNNTLSGGVQQDKFNIKNWWEEQKAKDEAARTDINEKMKKSAQDALNARQEWEERHPFLSDFQRNYQHGYESSKLDWEKQAKYGLDAPIKEQLNTEWDKFKKDKLVDTNVAADALLMNGAGTLGRATLRNGIAGLARNPISKEATRTALKNVKNIGKNKLARTLKRFANLGKEGAIFGAAHQGINNVYGVENEHTLPEAMLNDAKAFMLFDAGAEALGATGKFAYNKLNDKGGLVRNAKANVLKFERTHPVATRRIDNVLSQVKEAFSPAGKAIGDIYYKGVDKLNKLRDRAYSFPDDMLSNDQLAFIKKHGKLNTATEEGRARYELKRINDIKNAQGNVDYANIEQNAYNRALEELLNQGLKENEARSLLYERGMVDPEIQNQLMRNVDMLNKKVLGVKPKPEETKLDTLNKVEQAIDEGKPITKEAIHGVTPEEYSNIVERLRTEQGLDDAQISAYMEQHGIKLKEDTPLGTQNYEFIKDGEDVGIKNPNANYVTQQEYDNLVGFMREKGIPEEEIDAIIKGNDIAVEPTAINENKIIPQETPQSDLSMDKSKLGINTPKEDLTHVNEPSVSSQDVNTNIEQPRVRQDRIPDVSEKDRKSINRLWRRLNYIDAKQAGSAVPPYTKYPHKIIEGRMNRYYTKDTTWKAQVAYDKAVKQVKALDVDPRLKNIMLDDIDRAADSYTANSGFEIKRTQDSEQMLPNEADTFMSDLNTRLKTSLNEIISADVRRPPMLLKMLKIKNAMKKGDVEYNSKRAYEGIKNGIYNKKPVITTIRDLSQYDTKIAKDFEGLEDVVIEIRPKETSGLKGVFDPSDNTLWASDIETLYHEVQHYLQHNFSKLTKEQYNKAARETRIATKHLHKYIDFVDKKLNDFDKRIAEAGKANDIKTKNKLKLEKLNLYNKAIKNYHKWENKYKNSPLEIDAHYAGDNLTLIKNNSIVDMQKGYNYAKEGKLSTTRLLSTERETRILPEISKFTKGRYRQNNRRDIWRRQYSKQGLHFEATGGKEQFRKRTSTLGSRGLNDRGVIETLNHINDGDVAERVVKQLRENTLKRTGLLEAEQAAKAISMQDGTGNVWIQSNVPSKVAKTTQTLGEENSSKASKAGAFGHRETGEIKYTKREDRLRDDFTTAIRADGAHELADYAIKQYGVPIDKKVSGEYVNVNKKLLTQAIFLKNSKEWYQTIQEGDKAIEKVFKDKKVAYYYKQLHKTIQQPDCKIPKDVFDMLFDGTGEDAKTYMDRYWNASFEHSTNFGNKLRGVGKTLGGFIDGWNSGWKRNKLATLSFVINNRLGNQLLIAVKAGKHYLPSLIEAARMKDVEIPNEILEANIGEAFSDFIKKSPGQATNFSGYNFDKFFNLIAGVNLKTVGTKPIKKLRLKDKPVLTKQKWTGEIKDGKAIYEKVDNSKHINGQKIGSIYKNNSKIPYKDLYTRKLPKGISIKRARELKNPNDNLRTHFNNTASKIMNIINLPNKGMAKFAQTVNKVNDTFERFERKQAYYIAKQQYNKEKLKNFIGRTELYKNLASDINKYPEAKEAILRGIEDMLGNYRSFSKVERQFLKRFRPFYSWDRTIIRTTLDLAKKNPARAAWILYETKRMQNIQPDRKEYQQGSIDLPYKDKRSGRQLLINKREYGLPWSSLPLMDEKKWFDGLIPLITAPQEGIMGRKNFLNKEFNDRRYFAVQTRNDKGKKVIQYYDRKNKVMLDKLPAMPRINYVAKQLLADQVAPYMVNNLIKGDNLVGLIKPNKNGKRSEFDTPYDTSFGGFRDEDFVGKTTMKSKRGFPYTKVLKRMSAQDTSPSTKVLQRLGIGIQTKTPLSDFDRAEKKEQKRKQWREKHKRRK